MADPGYGPNGERVDPSGAISWQANAPPTPVTAGYDIYGFYPLGVVPIPYVDQNDFEALKHIYLGGA